MIITNVPISITKINNIIVIITILNSNVVLVNAGRKVRVIAQCVKFKDGKKVGLNNCEDNHLL